MTKAEAYERYQNLAHQQLVDDVYYDEDMQNHEDVLSYRELLPFADDMQEVKMLVIYTRCGSIYVMLARIVVEKMCITLLMSR